MLTWYGVLPDPWHLPHTKVSVDPVSDHGPDPTSLRAAVREAASGAAFSTAARFQRGMVATSSLTDSPSGSNRRTSRDRAKPRGPILGEPPPASSSQVAIWGCETAVCLTRSGRAVTRLAP